MQKSKSVILAIALVLSASLAQAAKMDGAPAADCEGLKVATGKLGKGYSKLYADLNKLPNHPALCEVATEGGLDNLDALSNKKADVGIVQVDTLKAMATSDEAIKALQVVATLNSNFLHVVVKNGGVTYKGKEEYFGLKKEADKNVRITSFSQLRGQPVAAVGSAQLLAQQLNRQLGYNMRLVDVATDDEAIKMVQQGRVLGMLTVAGWPHGALKNLKQESGVTLVPFDAPINAPYNVKPYSYKNLGVYNVQALSVQNVLVTRPFSGASKQAEVAALKTLIANNLDELKDGAYEPAWNEIKSLDSNVDWPRFNGGGAAKRK
jgi:TRAP-type uncharacterized transport system substrate-binding protein